PHRRARRRTPLRRQQGSDREEILRAAAPGGYSPSDHGPPDPVREPHAHQWLCRHGAERSLAADRGAGSTCDAGSFRLLSFLVGRRSLDLGREGDHASRRRRSRATRAPRHAADPRVSELSPAEWECRNSIGPAFATSATDQKNRFREYLLGNPWI